MQTGTNVSELIERVKTALLSMQRFSWEQGVAAQAFLELGELDWCVLLARDAVLRQTADGRLGIMHLDPGNTDPAVNGEPVLAAARLTGEPELAEAAGRMLDFLLTRANKTESGVLCHHIVNKEIWVDSIYMAPPFLAVAGQGREAVRQVEGMRQALWQADKRLLSHIWNDAEQKFTREDCWGVGNGWAAAGMTRIIAALPEELSQERQRVIGWLRELLAGCLAHQRPDGLFHDVIDRPDTFVETNLAQMLAYSIYRGVRGGWLEEELLAPAHCMRAAAHAKVDRHGFVQGVCGAPGFDRPGRAAEGQAFFLLMEAAARDAGF